MKLNQRGQFTIEAICLIAALTAISLYIGKEMKGRRMAAKVVEGPWQPVRGMIENGVWSPPKDAIQFHPNLRKRHASTTGDDPGGGPL